MTKSATIFVCMRNRVKHFDMTRTDFLMLEEQFPQFRFKYFDSRKEVVEKLAEADFMITWIFPVEWYQSATRLKAVFTPAAGKDWVYEDPSGKVKVFYGTFHGPMLAESLLGMMYMFNNQYLKMEQYRSKKCWDPNKQATRSLLANQKVLIIGYGNIGRFCGKMLKAVGCNVTGVKRVVNEIQDELGVQLVEFSKLDDELPKAGHVVLLLPGNDETKDLIHAEYFQKMKKTAIFYNFGRGTVVNENDLVDALQKGDIAAAGLDVFDVEPLPETSPLWTLPNVFITPHSSCCYQDYSRLFIGDVADLLQQKQF